MSLGEWKIPKRLTTQAKLEGIRVRIEERIKECKDAINLGRDNKNADGLPVAPSTAQTLRTRATKDLRMLQLIMELLNCINNKDGKVSLGETASKGLQFLLYPIKRS